MALGARVAPEPPARVTATPRAPPRRGGPALRRGPGAVIGRALRGRPGAPRLAVRSAAAVSRAAWRGARRARGYCIPWTLLERFMIGARLIRLTGMFEFVHIVAALVFVN